MKYCEFCGKQLQNRESCTCEQAVANIKPHRFVLSKNLTYVIIGVAVLLSIFLIGVLAVPSKIDPFDFITVTFSGYNTQGEAVVRFDKDSLVYEIVGTPPSDLSDSYDFKKYMEWEEKYSEVYNSILLITTPQTGLNNDDTVTVEITATGEAAKKVKSCKDTFTVSGLTEVETVDLFKDVELVFTGVSGGARAEIKLKTESEVLSNTRFNIEPMYNLKNGDVVVVSMVNSDALAEKYNTIPLSTSKEFKVDGLGKYVSEVAEISADTINLIANQWLLESQESLEDDFIFTYSEAKYYGTYLLVGKENAWLADNNQLQFFITYDRYTSGSYHSTIFEPLVFKDVIVDADGNVNIDYATGSSSTFTTDMDSYIDKKESEYTIIQIN